MAITYYHLQYNYIIYIYLRCNQLYLSLGRRKEIMKVPKKFKSDAAGKPFVAGNELRPLRFETTC